jgi:3-methyladenine DNA glycosylase AlkD
VAEVRRRLATAGDPVRAEGVRAYMKSQMPYRGVNSAPLRAVLKEVFAEHPLAGCDEWKAAVLELWRGAEFREERYAAIELTGIRRHRECQTLDALPMYREMITTGAWWDLVDGLATHRIGDLLRAYPGPMKREMRKWSRSSDLWLRRTAILSQVRFKADTDLRLLYDCIEPNLADRDFFIRKAIGWALRQYAWTDPTEIQRYVREHEAQLSGLSKREALKNIDLPGWQVRS